MDNRKYNKGRPSLYHWDEWLTKPRVVLVRGNHFHTDIKSFIGQIHCAASDRQIRTRVVRNGDEIVLWTRAPIKQTKMTESYTTESVLEEDPA